MTEKFEFTVAQNEINIRLDKFLSKKFLAIKPEINRSKIQKLIDEKLVCDQSGQAITTASLKTKLDQQIFVTLAEVKLSHLQAKEISFEIIYEDSDLLVINKPAGLTVHPGAGNHDDTLVNALLFTHKNKLSEIGGEFRPGIVHRLDKDTSGLMLVAKNDLTHQALSKDLQERKVKRSYLAFVYGVLNPTQGMINKNIIRSRTNRVKMSVTRGPGRSAITYYKTKETFCNGFISLIECNLETGRTHQIRVHMESMNHSLVGDQTYSSSKKTAPQNLKTKTKNLVANFARQALHSYKISFTHPRTKNDLTFETKLPDDLLELKKELLEASAAT